MTMPQPAVELARLNLGDQLGRGGVSTTFALPDHQIAGQTGPFVLKRFNPRFLDSQPALEFGLTRLVEMRHQIDTADRWQVDERMIWPLQTAIGDGRVLGVVSQQLPERFEHHMPLARGGTRRAPSSLMQYMRSPDRSAEMGLKPLAFSARLKALGQLATLLAALHRHGLILGELDGDSVFVDPVTTTGAVDVCLMFSLSWRTRQWFIASTAHMFGSVPPEVHALAAEADALPPGPQRDQLTVRARVSTQQADVYKFGLVVIRLLAMRDGVAILADPAIAQEAMIRTLGVVGTRVILAALAPDPGDRPTMGDIASCLTAPLGPAGVPLRFGATNPQGDDAHFDCS